jgi:hypothetical protein
MGNASGGVLVRQVQVGGNLDVDADVLEAIDSTSVELTSRPSNALFTTMPRDCFRHILGLRHILGYLCGDPRASVGPNPVAMLRYYCQNVLPLFVADPKFYLGDLRHDSFVASIVDFA